MGVFYDTTLVKLEETLRLLNEDESPSISVVNSSDQATNVTNKIMKPLGVVVQDTINNPIFKIPSPIIDTKRFDLPDIKDQFNTIYSKFISDYLPWHYVVEIIRGKYYFFQTRPLDTRFPLDNNYCNNLIKENNIILNEPTKRFFNNQPFELKDAIHICIIGDSNKDLYLDNIYYFMGKMIIGPILRFYKLSKQTKVLNFNLGSKFKFSKLESYMSR